jgi:selenide,water dikinase
MSDVFAMGGEVLFALQIAAWPEDLSIEQLETLFRGGVDKVREAGGVVAGGHTVIDREPKYGLAVTGRVHPDRILRKNALRVGDALWLTKPIGTGVLTTAHKNGKLAPEDLASVIASMVALNRGVTGFALAGHAFEMADQSRVGVRISAGLVPLLPAAREHAAGASFGGLERNRTHFLDGGRVRFDGIDDALRTLLLDPQTSGGLLIGVPAPHAAAWDRARAAQNVSAVRIGEVTEGQGVTVTA